MRVIMNTAAQLGMTSGEDPDDRYVFLYIDLYNGNDSYVWSNHDDYMCPGEQLQN